MHDSTIHNFINEFYANTKDTYTPNLPDRVVDPCTLVLSQSLPMSQKVVQNG